MASAAVTLGISYEYAKFPYIWLVSVRFSTVLVVMVYIVLYQYYVAIFSPKKSTIYKKQIKICY